VGQRPWQPKVSFAGSMPAVEISLSRVLGRIVDGSQIVRIWRLTSDPFIPIGRIRLLLEMVPTSISHNKVYIVQVLV